MADLAREPDLNAAAAAARAEWRAEEASWAQAAFERWHHDRTLLDVARDCMHRGDIVSLRAGSHTFTGVIVAVGDDFVRIHAAGSAVDVHFALGNVGALRVIDRAHAGGARGHADVLQFRARLLQLEMLDAVVELGIAGSEVAFSGWLAVGRDHVHLTDRDGAANYLPITSVAWVRPFATD
jgi:hypothetical protein